MKADEQNVKIQFGSSEIITKKVEDSLPSLKYGYNVFHYNTEHKSLIKPCEAGEIITFTIEEAEGVSIFNAKIVRLSTRFGNNYLYGEIELQVLLGGTNGI